MNYVTLDELVRHAINNPHSRTFDYLALFSMHLSKMGRRVGVAGDQNGAAFTNDFVRNQLWDKGGWQSASLNEASVESAFEKTIRARGDDTVHKCVTNYLYMMEVMGLTGRRTPLINTYVDEWIGPALFLAFDRYAIDRTSAIKLTHDDLVSMVKREELHKLMGAAESYVESMAPIIADKYLELGGVRRVTISAVLDERGESLVSSPSYAPDDAAAVPAWSDEDAEDATGVLRRLQERDAQIRNARNVRDLKSLYRNTCQLCGKKTVIGVDPTRHYSEAAHIKPLGQPHNGPDRKDNM
ncbi:MAG TPA: hypothetical protein VKV96_13300, partial [Roseiarcus sp.]|nr:hypothetical protein [Roseiarcus sp.]